MPDSLCLPPASSANRSVVFLGTSRISLYDNYVSEKDVFVLVIGGSYKSDYQRSTYPILLRETMLWEDRDRIFEDPLELKVMECTEVQSIRSIKVVKQKPGEPTRKRSIPKRSRRRVRDAFFGLKWVSNEEINTTTARFDSFNAYDANGTLHFCVPSTIFVGEMYMKDLRPLFDSEDSNLFNEF